MRAVASFSRVRPEEALLVGLTALALVAGLTVGAETPLAYLVLAVPVVAGLAMWRPVYGLALLLGAVLFSEQYTIETLAGDIKPFLLQNLPIFESLDRFTPVPVKTNVVELWLIGLTVIWAVKAIAAHRFQLRPVPCTVAWMLAGITLAVTFVRGMSSGGDLSAAIVEVRALGYLIGLTWLVPQIVEHRRDVGLLVGVMVIALAAKAVQGLYRYFVILGMHLDLTQTFLAHEDPVMFVPLFYLMIALWGASTELRLRRLLQVSTPIMFAALVLTQRRIAYITLCLCAVFFAFILAPAARRTFLRVTVPIALAGAAYAVAFAGSSSPLAQPIDRALTLFDPTNRSNLYRLIELENLRYTIQLHPWGIGFGQRYEILRSLPKLDWALYEYIPHNEILWIWVKAGWIGFILVMFFFARVVIEAVWTYRRLRDPLLSAVAAVVGIAVVNQLFASYYELQLTYGRNMIYLGTLIGLLGPIQAWGGLRPPPSLWRWRL